MTKLNRINKYATIGSFKISRFLFADDLVLLASSEPGFQHVFNGFAAARDTSKMKKSNSKAKVFHLSRNFAQCFLQFGGALLNDV